MDIRDINSRIEELRSIYSHPYEGMDFGSDEEAREEYENLIALRDE
jgi:hypothetical protein